MKIQSTLVLKDDLQAQINSAMNVIDGFPPRDQGEQIYRAGFHAALSAIATTNGLEIPPPAQSAIRK